MTPYSYRRSDDYPSVTMGHSILLSDSVYILMRIFSPKRILFFFYTRRNYYSSFSLDNIITLLCFFGFFFNAFMWDFDSHSIARGNPLSVLVYRSEVPGSVVSLPTAPSYIYEFTCAVGLPAEPRVWRYSDSLYSAYILYTATIVTGKVSECRRGTRPVRQSSAN